MTLHRLVDLVDQDVSGRMADLRSRNADGSLMYEHTANMPVFAPLTRVHVQRKNGERWFRWEWDTRGLSMPHACGFAGICVEGKYTGDPNRFYCRISGTVLLEFTHGVNRAVRLRLTDAVPADSVRPFLGRDWLRVETPPLGDALRQLSVRVMNGNQETEQVLDVPLAAIDPPIGWKHTYTIHCKPEQVERVKGWFSRGIKVKVDHALDRLGGDAFMPADVDTAPTWGYVECDVVAPEECSKVFNVVAYVREEFRMPKDQWSRKQYRKAAKEQGWIIESRNYGAHGYAWFRTKAVTAHSVESPGDWKEVGEIKAPETYLDVLNRLVVSPYDADQEREAIRSGAPIGRWILNRAEYHLNGYVTSAGNSTWMFDPESKGDPVKRG